MTNAVFELWVYSTTTGFICDGTSTSKTLSGAHTTCTSSRNVNSVSSPCNQSWAATQCARSPSPPKVCPMAPMSCSWYSRFSRARGRVPGHRRRVPGHKTTSARHWSAKCESLGRARISSSTPSPRWCVHNTAELEVRSWQKWWAHAPKRSKNLVDSLQ